MHAVLLILAFVFAGVAAVPSAGPAFLPDDPIALDPETEDAARTEPWRVSESFDLIENTFFGPGDERPIRAMNVNTIDEVPDSSWFTNRIGAERLSTERIGAETMSVETIVRGSDVTRGPADGAWTIVSGKVEGIQPGFTIRDTAGIVWFVKFDPPGNPEMASGAEIITTKLFWALGYHVPENHIATIRRESLKIGEDATIKGANGRPRRLVDADIDTVLARAAQNADGSYRALASKALEGRPLGPFRYHGTRPDDPNDIFPHEHRRELRGLRVFAAWLNHDDSGSTNSLDTLVQLNGRKIVRHHLIDFGSTLGSASVAAQELRAGNEYVWETRPTLLTTLTFGFWVRPWLKVKYPPMPAVGRLEASFFWPDRWKPSYRNAAFDNARDDDLFWGARKVMALSDEAIEAIVGAARYSDRAASRYISDVIIARRDKIGLAWLTHINPLVDFAIDRAGTLTFRNIAADTNRAHPASEYRVQWARFDNATSEARPFDAPVSTSVASTPLPAALRDAEFVQVEVGAVQPEYPAWSTPVRVQFRRMADGWKLVGVARGEVSPLCASTACP
jgi:hypothetical protein